VARDGIEPPTPAFSGLPTDPPQGAVESAELIDIKEVVLSSFWAHLG
jgi:hypothetical protein